MTNSYYAPLVLFLAVFTTPATCGESATSPPLTAHAASEERGHLAALAGTWNVKQSLWLKHGEPPQVDSGTAEFILELGGRALRQDLRVDSSTPFQGVGITGYDNVTRTWFTSWTDVGYTDLMLLRGVRDEGASTWRFSGTMHDVDGATIPTREELTLLDKDHLIARYYETKQGREALVVQLEYSRR